MSGGAPDRQRGRRRRIFLSAFGLFLLSLIAPPGRSQPAPQAVAPPAPEPAAASAPKLPDPVVALLRATANDMPAATPAQQQQWAGALLAAGQPAAAKRVAGKPLEPAALAALLGELVRRGQAEIALPLLETRRDGSPWVKAAAHWQLGQLGLVPRDLAEVPAAERPAAALVAQLAGMAESGLPAGLEANPWRALLLPPNGIAAPAAEIARVPPEAAASLAKWLAVQPNDGGAWAVLALVELARGRDGNAFDCLLRAESRGKGSAALQRLKAELQRQQSERNRAALAALDDPPANAPAPPAPAGFDPASIRALAAAGGGGALLGLLLGLQARGWLGRRRPAP